MSDDDPDPTDIDVDDLVFQDDLESFADEIESRISEQTPDADGFVEPEDAQGIADATFMDRLEHLVNDDCDTEQCNEIRDAFGIGGAEGDAEGEETGDGDGAEDGSEASEGDADGGDDSEGGDEAGESDDESGDGDDSEDEPRTNAFGEPY